MKKNDFIYLAIFLVIVLFLFLIPISAFLTSEILGASSAKSLWRTGYDVIKDHGSLIAGVIGFAGVFVLVFNQNKSTKETVEATLKSITLGSMEIDKRNNKLDAFLITSNLRKITQLGSDKKGHIKYEDISENLTVISDSIERLSLFMSRDYGCMEDEILSFLQTYILAYTKIKKCEDTVFTGRFPLELNEINYFLNLSLQHLREVVIKLDEASFDYQYISSAVEKLSPKMMIVLDQYSDGTRLSGIHINNVTGVLSALPFLVGRISSSLA